MEIDPKTTKFFSHPNRVNSTGFSPEKQNMASKMGFKEEESQYFKEDPNAQTSYQAFFKK